MEKQEKKHKITLFENGYGDCYIVKIYSEKLERYVNLLFDMGKGEKELIATKEARELDGIFVSHVDSDHINGIIRLLKNDDFKKDNRLSFIVFNKFNKALISYSQGNILSEEIRSQKIRLIESYRENYDTLNEILSEKINVIFFSKYKRDLLPEINDYQEKIFITFLLPDEKGLKNLMYEWQKDNIKKGAGECSKITNRSSIVCLIEFTNDDKKITILLTGDGYISDIKYILDNNKEKWGIDKIDCIKMPHHGSKDNNKEIINLINEYECGQLFYMSKSDVNEKDAINNIPPEIKIIRGNKEKIEANITERLQISNEFNIGE